MATGAGAGEDRVAVGLAAMGFAAFATIFVPGLYQELGTVYMVATAVVAVLVYADILAARALREKRRAHERPWVAVIAVIISLPPLLYILLWVADAATCGDRGTCSGGG